MPEPRRTLFGCRRSCRCTLPGGRPNDAHAPAPFSGSALPVETLQLPDPFGGARRNATLELAGEPGLRARARLGYEGTFELGVDRPGRYRLRIELQVLPRAQLVVLDELDLAEGTREYEVDLRTARLSLRVEDLDEVEPSRILHLWTGPGALRVAARMPVVDGRRELVEFPLVHAGKGQVFVDEPDGPARLLAEVDL